MDYICGAGWAVNHKRKSIGKYLEREVHILQVKRSVDDGKVVAPLLLLLLPQPPLDH